MDNVRWALLSLLVGCHGGGGATLLALRPACPPAAAWDGHTCTARGDGARQLATGVDALAQSEFDAAKAAFEGVERGGPLDHATHVTLWEQRGIVAAYLDDEPTASAAFEMLLALDPGHFLSYTLSPKATFVFEKVRDRTTIVPAIDVNWTTGLRVGDPVPLDVEVLADPKQFLTHATLFVRARGDAAWRAADLALAPRGATRVVLPAITARKPTSLELYLRAYDAHQNEVLLWATPTQPREIPLRYDPPTPWYRRWWVIAIAGTVVAGATGVIVYETTLAPPDKVGGTVSAP
ncbi:MAG: hypothetical protein NT062_18465 [Proteobacteria bacterium]|nr:hypothetical protein [Pseudomonadota bacterium]